MQQEDIEKIEQNIQVVKKEKAQQTFNSVQNQIKCEKPEVKDLFNQIVDYLSSLGVKFEVMEHVATRTSQESALIRNTPLEWGAKTMLVKGKNNVLFLLVYRANRKVIWSKLRKLETIGKKGAMCTEQQVVSLGVRPGGVPPFAEILGVKGLIDKKFEDEKMIAFNAGMQDKSIIMSTIDFPMKSEELFDFTE